MNAAESFGDESAVGWSGLAIREDENVFEADARVVASLRGFVDERPREFVQAVQHTGNFIVGVVEEFNDGV